MHTTQSACLAPLLLVAACGIQRQPATPDQADTGEESIAELPEETPCELDSSLFSDLSSGPTQVGTVATVSWSAPDGQPSLIEFSDDGGALWQRTSTHEEGGAQTALLLGAGALTSVIWRARATVDGIDTCGPDQTYQNGPLPSSLPQVSLTETSAEAHTGFITTSMITEYGSFIVIIDARGLIIWAHEVIDFVSGGRLSHDRTAVLYNTSHSDRDDAGYLHRLSLDGLDDVALPIDHFHTDFDETDNGVVALARDHRTFEVEGVTREIVGDRVIELTWDGETRELWSAFDSFEVDFDVDFPAAGYPYPTGYEDWSHANGVSWEPNDDSVLVTVARHDAVVRLERDDGQVRWILSAAGGDFAGGDQYIDWPHSAHIGPDGDLTLFNHNDLLAQGCASVNRLRLDTDAMTVTQVWSYSSEVCKSISYLGQGLPLSDGSTIVIWSTAGQMDQASQYGELLWRINADLGAAFGFSHYAESVY